MSRTLFTLILLSLCFVFVAGGAQKQQKPWTEWTQKDAEKVLTNSPWAQTQTDTDLSEMFYSPTATPGGRTPTAAARRESGATNQAIDVKFIVRFFSSRPVRRALVRLAELKQKPDAATLEKMHSFADLQSNESVILTLTYETTDGRYGGVVMQAFNSAITATLKNETYLERDGKRLFLEEYVAPGRDGFGARFIFPRLVDGKPFINDNSGEVRFRTRYPNGLKVDRVFKVADMVIDGQLEY